MKALSPTAPSKVLQVSPRVETSRAFRGPAPAAAPSSAGRFPPATLEPAIVETRRRVGCSAAATAELATYAFPPQASPVLLWFEQCIEDIVKHLDQAPLLQLVFPERARTFERHQVNVNVVAVPQLWRSIADYLSQSQPDILVLVHPLDDAETEKCILHHKTASMQQDVLTGIASHHVHTTNLQQRLSSCAGQLPAPSGTDVLQGKVGECCDEDHHDDSSKASSSSSFPDRASNGVSFYQTGDAAADSKRGHFAKANGKYPVLSEKLQQDWGLVVQSRHYSGAEGCYVLRTTHNSNPTADCQCTHYTLTRVCQGEPLGTQIGAAWLAN